MGAVKDALYSIYFSSRLIFLLTNGAGFASPLSAEGNEIFYPFTEQFQEENWLCACPCTAQAQGTGADLEGEALTGELSSLQPLFPETANEDAN